MTDGFSGTESASDLPQSKAERVRHRYSDGFRMPTPQCGNGDMKWILKIHL
jgi:hypothetical protein